MSIPNLSQLLYHYPPLSKLLCCENVCLAKDFHSPSSIQVTGSSGCTFKFKSSFKKGCELKIQILRFHILNLLCSTASCNPHVPLGLKAWGTGVLRAEYMWELAGRVLFLRFNAMINVWLWNTTRLFARSPVGSSSCSASDGIWCLTQRSAMNTQFVLVCWALTAWAKYSELAHRSLELCCY